MRCQMGPPQNLHATGGFRARLVIKVTGTDIRKIRRGEDVTCPLPPELGLADAILKLEVM